MKVRTGLAVGMLAILAGGCHPLPPCAPNDTSCLPCSDQRSTNPTCPSWPSDAKKPPKETR